MHDHLREWVRIDNEREPSPSSAIIDFHCVKSAALVSEQVGFDAGKLINGRKRFLTVDTLGLVLRVFVTAASVGERSGGKRVQRASQTHGQSSVTVAHDLGRWWLRRQPFHDLGHGRLSLDCTSGAATVANNHASCCSRNALVVERTFGWLMGSRRLVRDYELLPQTSETLIYLAMIRIMVRRLT